MIRPPANLNLVIRNLNTADPRILLAARIGLRRGLEYVATDSKKNYFRPSRAAGNPRRLVSLSGRLRQSIGTALISNGNTITGQIGTNVSYGAYHEFGFHGTQQVRAHTRIVGIFRKGKQVDQRRRYTRKGEVLGLRDTYAQALARTRISALQGITVIRQQVAAHTRRVDYYGRPFVRPALLQGRPMILEEIQKAIKAAL